jgi:acyl-coenzyme A thioesterase PaaI-like protein
MSKDVDSYRFVPGRYGVEITRVGESAVQCHLPLEPDKIGSDGTARAAAVLMGVDMAAGVAAGLGVAPDWAMTADTSVQFVGEARQGPLRVDARCIKPGRTQSLAEATVEDEGTGSVVAVATANHGVMRPTFANELMTMEIGGTSHFDRPADAGTGRLESHFGLSVGEGEVRIPVDERTRNPWGILHGGLTGLVVEVIASSVGMTTLDEVMMRFMRPVRVGPGRATVAADLSLAGRRVLRIEMWDEGAERLAVLAHLTGH